MPLPTTADEVWPYIEKWPFAVLSFVTPKGESRSAGIMYQVEGRALYVLTGEDTWKVRHIRANPNVSMTVTIPRLPIRIRQVPPAVISFAGVASVLSIEEIGSDVRARLTRGTGEMPGSCIIRIEPEGCFVTYGIGIPALQMRDPEKSRARVPVG
jgi:general stress protein 26